MTPVNRSLISRTAARLALALALLAAAANLPNQWEFIQARLPIMRLWFDPHAQQRLQLGAVPYDLLRAADAALPRDASVLLVTSGRDIRHHEYTTFHRALYYLAPRPVWWLAPAPPDGTWESRWWISAPLDPATVRALAAEKGVSHILAYDLSQPLAVGQKQADLGGGELLLLGTREGEVGNDPAPAGWSARATYAGTAWPIRLALALAVIMSLGYTVVAVVAGLGYRASGIEAAALAWTLGAGLTSIGMLWLNALGVGLYGQIVALTALAIGGRLVELGVNKPAVYATKSTKRGRPRRGLMDGAIEPSRASFLRVLRGEKPWTGLREVALGSWWFGQRRAAAQTESAQAAPSPRPTALPRLGRVALAALLVAFLAIEIAFVTAMAAGQPLNVWDSWSSWGMKARTIFLEGSISPAVYADPTRASTLPLYPLLVPLVEAWIYGWLGAPDDRLVGVVSVLFYLALAGICYAAIRRRGAARTYALGVTVVVASIPYVALLAGLVFIDVPLAVFATLAATYLLDWLDSGSPGALVIAALAAGLMPWTKREGLVLLTMLCLAAMIAGRNVWPRAWRAVGAALLAAALLAGPWWVFITLRGGTNPDFMPATMAALQANIGRLPTIAQMARAELLSANWSYLWPLALVCGLLGWVLVLQRNIGFRSKSHSTLSRPEAVSKGAGSIEPHPSIRPAGLLRMLDLWLLCAVILERWSGIREGTRSHAKAYIRESPLRVSSGPEGTPFADREQYLTSKGRTVALLPLTIFLYLGVMCLGYVFSTFAPYQEHIESSLFRLTAHTVPMLALWVARQGIEVRETS